MDIKNKLLRIESRIESQDRKQKIHSWLISQ